jgi:DNA-binding response OmpR family regulator
MIKVLLLEDDVALAMGMEFTLKEEGYEVTIAGRVDECLQLIDTLEFDIAILDISLPDGSGYDVCKYIRTKSEMPIIFLTAYDDEVNVVLGLEIGADDYITKPFRVRELVSRIKAILRRSSRNTSTNMGAIFKSGHIELNTLTATLKKNQKEIPLSAQEYKLLLIFMRNPKHVLSKDLIFEKLVESEVAFMDDNTLSVYVKRLREKIEDKPSEPTYIVTKRGLGYTWDKIVMKE